MAQHGFQRATPRRGLGWTTGGEVDYRIIWGTSADCPPADVVGSGRGAIEALLEQAGAKVVWAEVFDRT